MKKFTLTILAAVAMLLFLTPNSNAGPGVHFGVVIGAPVYPAYYPYYAPYSYYAPGFYGYYGPRVYWHGGGYYRGGYRHGR